MFTEKIKSGFTKAADKLVEAEYSLYTKAVMEKNKAGEDVKNHLNDNRGMAVVEIVLIIAVTVGIMYVFKDRIGKIVKDIFDGADKSTKEFMKTA